MNILQGNKIGGGPKLKDLITGVFIVVAFETFIIFCLNILAGSGYAPLLGSPGVFFTLSVGMNIFGFCVAWFFLCHKYNCNLEQGFALHWVNAESTIISFFLGLLLPVLVVQSYPYVEKLVGPQAEEFAIQHLMFGFGPLIPVTLGAFWVLTVLMPIFEEFYYRGFVFKALQNRLSGKIGTICTIIIVALWFGAAHLGAIKGNIPSLLLVTSVGTIFTIQRAYYKSLIPSIITHTTYNATLLFFALLSMS